MKLTLPERIQKIMGSAGLNQTSFGTLAGVTKGAVNQWISGEVKSIGARYAFNVQRKTGFSAEWLMLGTGPEKIVEVTYLIDPKTARVVQAMERMDEYKKDTMVKISDSLAEPDGQNGPAAAQ